jgi:hypothetical protein
MCRPLLICAILAAFSIGSSLVIANDLIEGSDPRAQPIKKALADVVEQIEAGDFDKAKALYAGSGADLELLKAYPGLFADPARDGPPCGLMSFIRKS